MDIFCSRRIVKEGGARKQREKKGTLIMGRVVKGRMFPLTQLPLNNRPSPMHTDWGIKTHTNVVVLLSPQNRNIQLKEAQWIVGNHRKLNTTVSGR